MLGARFVIAIELNSELPDTPPGHLFGVLKRSFEISYNHHSRMGAEGADFVIKIPFKNVGTFDNDLNDQIYQAGRETTRKAIEELKQKLTHFKN